MEVLISDKMRAMQPSAIREMFKYTANPEVISLAAGDPAPESLPVVALQKIMAEILQEDPMKALLYSFSEGYPPLREAVRNLLRDHYGLLSTEQDEIMITSGAQQCMDLVTKVLCNEGDTVICEDPSFIGALNAFRSYGVNLAGVPMQDDGMDLEALEKALQAHPKTRFIYTIPNFQNPTGITMSLAKRKAVYELALRYKVLILEDNPYGDLRFEGEPLPSIKSMDTEGIVIYAGSFSKILATGIRVGYMAAPKEIFGKLTVAKQCTDVHTSMLGQLLCLKFLQQYDIAAHVEGLKVIYRDKAKLMLREIEQQFPSSVQFTRPQGGIFIWCTLPDGMDTAPLALELVKEHKVCVVPGITFLANPEPSNCFRMNFSMPAQEKIITGIARVGAVLCEQL